METLLQDIVEQIVASIIAAPILFIAGFYARPLWNKMLGNDIDDSSQLPASEIIYLVTLVSILGGTALLSAYLAGNLLHVSVVSHISRSVIILAFVFYLIFSFIFHFLGVSILSTMKSASALDVSAGTPTAQRNRVFAVTIMAKLSVFLLMSGWALWASPPHLWEPFMFGIFFLFFIDIIGAIVMLLLD